MKDIYRSIYVKMYFVVNIKTKEIVFMSVTTDEVHGSKEVKKLVDYASKRYDVKKVYMIQGIYSDM